MVEKECIREKIGNFQDFQEHRSLTDDAAFLKAHLAMEYEEVAWNGEIHWRQKSRIQRVKNGDENTKFFQMVTVHKRNNTIESLVYNGELSSDPVIIRIAIVDFYQIL